MISLFFLTFLFLVLFERIKNNKMVSGIFKFALKALLSNPRVRREVIDLGEKTYKKAKPKIKKNLSVLKETIKVVSPIDNPKKFKKIYKTKMNEHEN